MIHNVKLSTITYYLCFNACNLILYLLIVLYIASKWILTWIKYLALRMISLTMGLSTSPTSLQTQSVLKVSKIVCNLMFLFLMRIILKAHLLLLPSNQRHLQSSPCKLRYHLLVPRLLERDFIISQGPKWLAKSTFINI